MQQTVLQIVLIVILIVALVYVVRKLIDFLHRLVVKHIRTLCNGMHAPACNHCVCKEHYKPKHKSRCNTGCNSYNEAFFNRHSMRLFTTHI